MSALDCIGKPDIADRKHTHFSFVLTVQPAEIVLKSITFCWLWFLFGFGICKLSIVFSPGKV